MYKKVKNDVGLVPKKLFLLVTILSVFITNAFAGGGGIEEKQNGIPMTGQVNTSVSNALLTNTAPPSPIVI